MKKVQFLYPAVTIISVIVFSYFKLIGMDYMVPGYIFNLFHFFVELSLCFISACIFFLITFSYPYENNKKALVPASFFLCIAVTNSFHIYYLNVENMESYSMIASNLTYLLLSIIILLKFSLGDKPISKNNRLSKIIPVCFTFFCIALVWIIDKYFSGINPTTSFVSLVRHTFSSTIEAINIATLIMAYLKSKKDKNSAELKLLLNCVFYLVISEYFILIYVTHYDLYSMIGHTYRLLAFYYLIRVYLLSNIVKPYEKVADAKKEAEEACKIKMDFITNMSHELRTPINIILNASKLMKNTYGKSTYLKSIENNTLRLNKVCENIIEFNNIENGINSIDLSDTDVVFLIDEILEEADDAADEKNVDIEFNSNNNITILTDKHKFKCILLQLISNSIKYAPDGGQVIVNASYTDKLTIEIYNNGPKITIKNISKVFNKFYKVKDSSLNSTEGLGIGLYIARKYVEMLGGEIKLFTNENSTGYIFTINAELINNIPVNTENYDIKGFFSDIS